DLSKPIPPAPNCHVCNAPAGENHAKDCVWLSCLRASAYPQVLDDNGREWRDNLIDKLQKENAELKSSNNSVWGKYNEKYPTIKLINEPWLHFENIHIGVVENPTETNICLAMLEWFYNEAKKRIEKWGEGSIDKYCVRGQCQHENHGQSPKTSDHETK